MASAVPRPNLIDRVGVALAHDLAAVRAREMHAVALGRADELADLVEAVRRQPALTAATLDGEAIGRFLVGAAKLVAAFVREDPLLHDRRHLGDQARIENEKTRISGAVVIELAVEHGRTLATGHLAAVQPQFSGLDDLGVTTDMGGVFLRRRTGRTHLSTGRDREHGRHAECQPPRQPPSVAFQAQPAFQASASFSQPLTISRYIHPARHGLQRLKSSPVAFRAGRGLPDTPREPVCYPASSATVR